MRKKYEIPSFARHLNLFCEDARGPVLQKTGIPRRYRYRSLNPLLQPFVIMLRMVDGLVTEQALEGLARGSVGTEDAETENAMDANRFHDQALSSLGEHSGEWHCMECWSWASDLTSPEDVARLRALARSLQSSDEHEVRRGGTCDRCKKPITDDPLIRKKPDQSVAARY